MQHVKCFCYPSFFLVTSGVRQQQIQSFYSNMRSKSGSRGVRVHCILQLTILVFSINKFIFLETADFVHDIVLNILYFVETALREL